MKILDTPRSGSQGMTTASRNRSGKYLRQRAMPTQPRTAAQINARSRLTSQAAAWRGLTDNQRAAWQAFAASFTVNNSLGTTINLTGAQCFVKVNTTNLLIGDATVTTPPALPAFAAALTTGLTLTAGTPAVKIAGSGTLTGVKYMMFASPQLSAGVSYCGSFRYLATFTNFTTGFMDLTTAYSAKFGAPIVGKKIFVKVVQSQLGMQDNGTLYAGIVQT